MKAQNFYEVLRTFQKEPPEARYYPSNLPSPLVYIYTEQDWAVFVAKTENGIMPLKGSGGAEA